MTTIELMDRKRVPVLNLQVDLCDYETAIMRIDKIARGGIGG